MNHQKAYLLTSTGLSSTTMLNTLYFAFIKGMKKRITVKFCDNSSILFQFYIKEEQEKTGANKSSKCDGS